MTRVVARLGGVSVSPKKINIVLKSIRTCGVDEALKKLRFMGKKSAPIVGKMLQSARANAEHNHGLRGDELFIDQATAGDSTVLKRLHIKGRGRSGVIRKRKSYVYVSLTTDNKKTSKEKRVAHGS